MTFPDSTESAENATPISAAGKSGSQRGGRNARRRSREFAVQGIYQWLVAATDAGLIEADLSASPEFKRCDAGHLTALLHGTITEYASLNERISPHLDRKVEHVSPVERAVLLVATYELLHHPEIPFRVVISEAIDLTKVFGGTDGHRFVNGVLDRVAKDCGTDQGLR
ncbi:MAG: transcription antitermination factor NusB [Burkholderiaceae bacterium]